MKENTFVYINAGLMLAVSALFIKDLGMRDISNVSGKIEFTLSEKFTHGKMSSGKINLALKAESYSC